MADIFLSYKREDRTLVETLAKAFEDDGLSVWWDTDLPLGKSYVTSISSALMEAKVVIPVWTARSVQSEWVQEEATTGKRRGALIPVRLEAVDPPIGFGMIQTADLSDWTPGDASHPEWIKLMQSVRAMIGAPAAGTPSEAGVRPMPIRRGRKPFPFARAVALAVGLVVVGVGGYFAIRQQLADSPPSQALAPAEPASGATTAAAAPAPAPAPAPAASETAAPDPATFQPAAGGEPAARTPDEALAIPDFVFAPDGRTALSGGHDGTVTLLDAATSDELKRFRFPSPVVNVSYSKTGSHAVVGTADGIVTMTEIATGSEDGRFETAGNLQKMAVAPDDGSVAVLDNRAVVRIYQADGVLLKQFPTGRVARGIAWCPESDCLLVWGDNGLLEIWDPFKPRRVDSLRGHAGTVRAAAFSADGRYFVTAADGEEARVWHSATGKLAGFLLGEIERPTALAWSRDSQRVAIATGSGKAFVWRIEGTSHSTIGPGGGRGSPWVAFTPDGKNVVLGGWDSPVTVRIPD